MSMIKYQFSYVDTTTTYCGHDCVMIKHYHHTMQSNIYLFKIPQNNFLKH